MIFLVLHDYTIAFLALKSIIGQITDLYELLLLFYFYSNLFAVKISLPVCVVVKEDALIHCFTRCSYLLQIM